MSDAGIEALRGEMKSAMLRGDYGMAHDLCAEMLRRRRHDLVALLMMADIAAATRSIDEEVAYLARAVRAQPKDPGLRVRLGHRSLVRGKFAAALDQFDKALKLEPDLPAAVAGKAQVHEVRGRYDRARRVLAPALRRAAPDPIVAAIAVRVLVHDGELEEAIALGRRVLGAGPAPSPAVRSLGFALARAHERRGDYDEAFATASAANAVLRGAHDPEAVRRRVDEIIAVFSAERLAALPRASARSDAPVFIVGMPRCGSTLLDRILHAHPDAHGAGELELMRPLIQDLPRTLGSDRPYPACIAHLGPGHVDDLARAYLDPLQRLAPGARRIADKNLANFMHLGLVDVLFPAGRVIHCRRDPVDTCLSCFMEPLARTQVAFASDLRWLGLYHREYARLMAHWSSVLDVARLEVDYEELVADQEPVTRRLLDFCGLDWNDACLRFHEVKRDEVTLSFDQVRRPLYATAVGRAAGFGAHLDPLREALEGR